MLNLFAFVPEGGVKIIKCFKEGATYKILETSILRQYTDIEELEISVTRMADVSWVFAPCGCG